MEEVAGSLGTSGSLFLRLGQIIFSTASLFFMCLDFNFYNYTAFCFLVTVMGLVVPWSVTLALVDAYCVFIKRSPRHPRILTLIVISDWILSLLSLAAATSAASVAHWLLSSGTVSPSYCAMKICSGYPLSASMALWSWSLSLASSLFNIWALPRL